MLGWQLGIIVSKVSQLDFQENSTMVNLAFALENEGISSFRFDFAGNGRGCRITGFEILEYNRLTSVLRAVPPLLRSPGLFTI
ncbi:hypothetical protein DVH24_018129 [Malus domestica]|uniref:Uncharacterized protein n=1 Tax=Malus domestica TaxID=3750 RepID=A0A498KFD1_MALDO|nr:hypothetical protein DVH24_018129 [Malus domestica]